MANPTERSPRGPAEQRIEDEAMRVAKSIQTPGQTKEQTRLIAKGIEKGIALYKQQQSAKLRERDKLRKKVARMRAQQRAEDGAAEPSVQDEGEAIANAVGWTLAACGGLFALMAMLHLLRYFLAWELVVGPWRLDPVWSIPAALIASLIAGWLLRLARRFR